MISAFALKPAGNRATAHFLFYKQLHLWVQARVGKGFPCFQAQSCL